jgi:heme-degrading monooxygenase HmoA/GGDEF domain-containing protein
VNRLDALAAEPDRGGALLVIDRDAPRLLVDDLAWEPRERLRDRLSKAVEDVIGADDVIARLDGDAIAVLLPGATTAAAAGLAERIRAAGGDLASHAPEAGSLSIGIAEVSDDARDALLAAETALNEAKAAGGARVVVAGREPAESGDARGIAAYVSMSRLEVPVDRAPDLVEAFRARLGLVDRADGFVDLQVWQSDRDAGEIVMVSRWRDKESFKAYMRSPEHKLSHERIPREIDEVIKLRRLEHLHTFEVVAE